MPDNFKLEIFGSGYMEGLCIRKSYSDYTPIVFVMSLYVEINVSISDSESYSQVNFIDKNVLNVASQSIR